MATALDGEVAPTIDEGLEDKGDVGCGDGFDAACWADFLLFRVPDCKGRVVFWVVEAGRREYGGELGTLVWWKGEILSFMCLLWKIEDRSKKGEVWKTYGLHAWCRDWLSELASS